MLKTSEFWMTILSALVGALVSLHVVSPAVADIALKFIGMALTYVFGRLVSKAAKAVFASPTDNIRGIGKMVLAIGLGLGLTLAAAPAHALSLRWVPALSVWAGVRDGKALVGDKQAYGAARLGWDASKRIGVQVTAKRASKGGKGTEYEAAVGFRIF